MMPPKLGRLVQGDLREIWPTEPQFSKWLSEEENLSELASAVGIGIVSPECESEVGAFSVDLFAQEDGGDRKIIIENQLEQTDHDHLGKIITYAAGKDAKIILWIVRQARDEHRAAVKWLNENSSDDIGFFLLEIAVWRIGSSEYAPMFRVIEKPNEWTRQARTNTVLTPTKEIQLSFWTQFMEYAMQQERFSRLFNSRLPKPQHWLDLAAGSADYHISLTVDTRKKKLGTAIYIPDNKTLFDHFSEHRSEIESELGFSLEWQRLADTRKAARILHVRTGDLQNQEAFPEYFRWFCECSIKMKTCFAKYAMKP